MNVALFITDTPTVSVEEIERFTRFLTESGFSLYEYPAEGCRKSAAPVCLAKPDMAISIGGDGTFLRMARRMAQMGVPVVGVNAGHLGFLTQYGLDEAPRLAEDILEGRLKVEERMLLQVECEGMPDDIWPYALNEVAALKANTSSMLDTSVYDDGDFVADYLADGVLVTTPTGSTAYALAAGGPLMVPSLDCMALLPVAPHTLTLRPMVFPGDTELRLESRSRAGNCRISIDGNSFSLPTPARFYISRAPFHLKVYTRPDATFYTTLRHKLHWAQR